MFRFAALNNPAERIEYDSAIRDVEMAKEAQEFYAENEFLRGNVLLSNNDYEMASSIFMQLLDTAILNQIPKESRKLSSIRFNCYKNLAFINEESDLSDLAVSNYKCALQIDRTDTSTMFRLGQLSLKIRQYELAEYAFLSCLKQNQNHYPAAHGVLKLFTEHNNIMAAYGLAIKLINQNQTSKLVVDTMNDMTQRFFCFIPICEQIYGIIPKNSVDSLSSLNTFKTFQNIIYEAKFKSAPKMNPPNTNFCDIGKLVLTMFDYVCLNRLMMSLLQNPNHMDNKNYVSLLLPNITKLDSVLMNSLSHCVDLMSSPMSIKKSDITAPEKATERMKPKKRCSDLRLLEQWGWHKNRKYSSRKKYGQDHMENTASLAGFLRKYFIQFMHSSYGQTGEISTTSKFNDCNTCQNSSNLKCFEEQIYDKFMSYCLTAKETVLDIGILSLLWLKHVSELWNIFVPISVKDIYIKLYLLYTDLFGFPKCWIPEMFEFSDLLNIQLFFLEVQYDKSIKMRSGLPKEWKSSLNKTQFLFGLSIQENDHCFDICALRILNLEFLESITNTDDGKILQQLDFILEILHSKPKDYGIHLPNISSCCITYEKYYYRKIDIERKKKLKQIPTLLETNELVYVCGIITEELNVRTGISIHESALLDFNSMYKILIECLWKTGKVKECLIYSESFLHFSMQSYFHELNGLWIDSISFSLSYIEYIITTQGNEMVDALKGNLSRLVQDIINILSCLLDEDVEKKTKTSDEIKVRSSWTILYNILLREDQINHNLIDIPDEEARLPASFRLLFTAHQYMGRSQSCTLDNGEFLQFILRSIIPELHAPMYDSCRNHVLEYIEQITYCLYGFPQKKSRSRYLENHNAGHIPLTLEIAIGVFDIYAPDPLPDFNSYKIESITGDMEQFLLNLIQLLPKQNDIHFQIQNIDDFISGARKDLSKDSLLLRLPFKVKNIYYLLADYYFKSRDFLKAIKYYITDLAVNLNRFDSWAGISLSKASIVETQINGLDPLDSNLVLMESDNVIRCFGKCVSLLENHSLVWIEYGSFAYLISSYCSRTLKNTTLEKSPRNDQVKEKKEKMLRIAYHCFSVAATLQCLDTVCVDFNEERWLCQYMLGKIAEKQSQQPDVFLNYYLTASNFLYDSNATYPIKINHNNPTTLSVEALELFYRTNAAILKYLEKGSYITRPIGDHFKCVLKQLSSSPFAFNKAKINDSCIYAVKRKYIDPSKNSVNKNELNDDTFIKANTGENSNFVELPRVKRNRFDSEETLASEPLTISTNSSSSFLNFDTESETSNTDKVNSYYSESEVENIYMKAIINLEECVIRFPEHYKSIYRLVSFYINGPDRVKNENISERLLLSQYQTGIGNIINGLFYDRKANNIFNGIWRIPSSEIDRPGNFSSYLVKCVDILIKLLTNKSNYNLLIEIILQLQRSPDNDKRYIMDSDRLRLLETAIKNCQKVIRKKLNETLSKTNEKELLNFLIEIYKIQKKSFKYVGQKETWFENIFVEVYLAYIGNKLNVLPSNANYLELAVKLCHQEINQQKILQKQNKQGLINAEFLDQEANSLLEDTKGVNDSQH